MFLALLLVTFFTILSGLGDAYGFTHASAVWQNGRLVWRELLHSCLGFQFGFVTYWLAIRYLQQLGVVATEPQTLLWFGVTIIGVAVLNGNFFSWQRPEQLVAIGVLVGLGWLLFRAGG